MTRKSYRKKPATGPSLGIIGGGQLARMTTIVRIATRLQCRGPGKQPPSAPPPHLPATRSSAIGTRWMHFRARPAGRCHHFGERIRGCQSARRLSRSPGQTVCPTSRTLALVQDKFIQKQALQSAGLPIPRMLATDDLADLEAAIARIRFPDGSQGPPQCLRRQGQRDHSLGGGHHTRLGTARRQPWKSTLCRGVLRVHAPNSPSSSPAGATGKPRSIRWSRLSSRTTSAISSAHPRSMVSGDVRTRRRCGAPRRRSRGRRR